MFLPPGPNPPRINPSGFIRPPPFPVCAPLSNGPHPNTNQSVERYFATFNHQEATQQHPAMKAANKFEEELPRQAQALQAALKNGFGSRDPVGQQFSRECKNDS
eukprot:4138752-Alexandrium_andersonii.AAC.1